MARPTRTRTGRGLSGGMIVLGMVGAAVVVAAGLFIANWLGKDDPPPGVPPSGGPAAGGAAPSAGRPEVVEALVPMFEGELPFTTGPVEWPFTIYANGAFCVKYPGFSDPTCYADQGDFRAPNGIRSGELEITSNNGKTFKAYVYRVAKVIVVE